MPPRASRASSDQLTEPARRRPAPPESVVGIRGGRQPLVGTALLSTQAHTHIYIYICIHICHTYTYMYMYTYMSGRQYIYKCVCLRTLLAYHTRGEPKPLKTDMLGSAPRSRSGTRGICIRPRSYIYFASTQARRSHSSRTLQLARCSGCYSPSARRRCEG